MANRFIRLIEEGTIASEGELKSAFRAHALATHPDLGTGTGHTTRSPGEEFMKARAEYEAAVRYLAPGASRKPAGYGFPSHGDAGHGDRPATTFGRKRNRFDRALFYADLSALIKAGFPKTARHDAERRKYARLRLHVRSSLAALDGARPGSPLVLFDAFERALAGCKESASAGLSPREVAQEARFAVADSTGLLLDLIAYEACGIVPLRASIEIGFAGLRQASTDADLLGFLGFLVGDMDGGTVIL